MTVFSLRPVLRPAHGVLALGLTIAAFACGASQSPVQSSQTGDLFLALADDGGSVCALNESVTDSGGTYSSNVDLTASVALAGEAGVDVVMTPVGAIAAVNTSSDAKLYWVNPATGAIETEINLPDAISDITFDGERTIAVASGEWIIKIDIRDSDERLRSKRLPGLTRVAIAHDGHIAAIANKTVHLYDSNNQEVFSKLRDYTAVTDVEVLSCGDQQAVRQSVYVTSFRNTSFVDLEDKRNPIQISRLEALDFSGEVQWSLFGDPADTIKQNVADTRLYRTTLGRDGYLYIAGESAGTATIFRWRGQPMTAEEQVGRAEPFLSRIDENSLLHNSGAAHLPYYARVHPTTGELVTSQMSFPRRSNRKANAMRLGDVATGSDGTLYFGGAASASIPNRDNLTLNGVSIGGYGGRDRAWMAIAPNFQTRKFWTVLAEEGGKGTVQGVDVGYGYSAAISNVESGTVPVTTGEQAGTVFLSFTTE
ncbi:MAG: hypothetical protein AAFU53_06870 [Cyanobacteria bacterium J06632_3]